MNDRSFLWDRTFLLLIWPHLLGCISQSIASLVFLVAIWLLSGSLASFFRQLQPQMTRILTIPIFLTVLMNVLLLLRDLGGMRYYLSSPINTTSNLEEIRVVHKDGIYLFRYLLASLAFVAVALIFLLGYFVEGENWDSALLLSFLYVFPFPLAFLAAHFAYIVAIQMPLLILRYKIQRSRD
jgi:hypothetical protein